MALFEARTTILKNGKTIILRPAVVAEAEVILKTFQEFVKDSPYVLSTPETAAKKTVEAEVKWIENSNSDPRAALIVAEDQGRIIGLTNMMAFKDGKRGHRAGLGMTVHKDYQGQGLGKALLSTLIEVATQAEGLHYLELNVMSANVAAYNLYRKFNFKEVGFLPKAYRQPDGSYTDDIAMYLKLS